jgi:hypothetical protein
LNKKFYLFGQESRETVEMLAGTRRFDFEIDKLADCSLVINAPVMNAGGASKVTAI